MSCEECNKIQKETDISAYFRIGNANIEVRGCEKHLWQVKKIFNNHDELVCLAEAIRDLPNKNESLFDAMCMNIRGKARDLLAKIKKEL